MSEIIKKCITCRKEKNILEFSFLDKKIRLRRNTCKTCQSQQAENRHIKNDKEAKPKICNKCNTLKPYLKFSRGHNTCKNCQKLYREIPDVKINKAQQDKNRRGVPENKAKILEYERQRRQIPEIQQHNRSIAKAYSRSLLGRYNSAKKRGIKKDGIFSITLKQYEILISQLCTYCNGELSPTGSGIDRINNSVGYVLNNCTPCCKICNRVKGAHFSYQQMMKLKPMLIEFRLEREKGTTSLRKLIFKRSGVVSDGNY